MCIRDRLYNHSHRVYLFALAQGRQQKLRFDSELLYVAAAFHDLGLIKKYQSATERFEVDGANAARQFLTAHDIPEYQIQTVWEAVSYTHLYNQGVGYLDDGTMVVVDHARRVIGRSVEITVTSVLQTASGKMIFGRIDEPGARTEPARTAVSVEFTH